MDSLLDFTQRFGTVDACLKQLEGLRWAEGPYCPLCGGYERIYHFSDGRRHKCGDCRRVFRIIAGTMFADTPIKLLPKWFAAIWLDTCHSIVPTPARTRHGSARTIALSHPFSTDPPLRVLPGSGYRSRWGGPNQMSEMGQFRLANTPLKTSRRTTSASLRLWVGRSSRTSFPRRHTPCTVRCHEPVESRSA